jgi:3-hydroxyisobutyrate dehydrogenase
MTLKLLAIGALGNMLGPSAQHLQNNKTAKFIRILDRGASGDTREKLRADWKNHGAQSVDNFKDLIGDGEFDGIVICAGKNGDDYDIFKQLISLLNAFPNKKYFILHLSTVSCDFVTTTYDFCKNNNIEYVNYPLTGGVKGAANATMLILCSGNETFFQKLQPFLTAIGKPKFLGSDVALGAATKLIGHVLVFHGLLGVSLGVNLHKSYLNLPALNSEQTEFFDFLNQGAGGSKQWDFAVKPGVAEDNWSQGFLLRHAAIDIIYTLQLLQERNCSEILCLGLIQVSLMFSYLLNKYPTQNLCTQAVTKLIAETPKRVLDHYLEKYCSMDIGKSMENCIFQLPEQLRNSLMLKVSY